MSLLQRKISVKYQLGQGNFGESGFNTLELDGARCQVSIQRAGLPFMAQATIRVFGLPPQVMNQLSTLGGNPLLQGRLNQISVFAGDDVFGQTEVFTGIIQNGYQDYQLPDASFVAEAAAGGLDLLKPTSATSYKGTVDVATVLQGLASRMTPPLAFTNNGVSVQVANPYLSGTLIDQIRTVIRLANINGEIHAGTLIIWPRNGKRPVAPVNISPSTGLVGYPSFNGAEMVGLRTIFLPTLAYGQEVQVTSSLPPACGNWYVAQMAHTLESQVPDGAWFTDMTVMSLTYFAGQPAY